MLVNDAVELDIRAPCSDVTGLIMSEEFVLFCVERRWPSGVRLRLVIVLVLVLVF